MTYPPSDPGEQPNPGDGADSWTSTPDSGAFGADQSQQPTTQYPYGQYPYADPNAATPGAYGQPGPQSSYGQYQFGQDPSQTGAYGQPGAYDQGYGAPYGQIPPGYGFAAAPTNSGMAVGALVCGIASFPMMLLCGIFGLPMPIVAVILGILGKREIASSGGTKTGDGMALAGIILGAIGIVLMILFGVFIGFAVVSDL